MMTQSSMKRKRLTLTPIVAATLALGLGLATWMPQTADAASRFGSVAPSVAIMRLHPLPSSPMAKAMAVAFVSPRTGWLAGNGMIEKTTDGGERFFIQYRGPAQWQYLQILNANTVVAWGPTQIAMTANGGRTWTTMASPPGPSMAKSTYLLHVDFVNTNEAFALVGNNYQLQSTLYKTTNGGKTWSDERGAPGGALGFGFGSAQDGWLVTGVSTGGIYRTTDGGAHWVRTTGALRNWMVEGANIFPTGADSAYVQLLGGAGMSQSSSSLFKTSDGAHFQPVEGVATAGAGSAPGIAQFPHGEVTGNGRVASGPGYDAGPVAVVNQRVVRVVGGMEATGIGEDNLATTADGGAHWVLHPPIPGANGMAWNQSLSFANAQDGWLLLTQNLRMELLRTTNGGSTWQLAAPGPSPRPVLGVDFVSPSVGYGLGVIGDLDAILRTDNGGKSWRRFAELPARTELPYDGPDFGQGIDFATASMGWAIGADGHLYATDDAAAYWREIETPRSAGAVTRLYVADGGRLGAIQATNSDWVTQDGGKKWTEIGSAVSSGSWSLAVQSVSPHEGSVYNKVLGKNADPQVLGQAGAVAWIDGTLSFQPGFRLSTDGGKHWLTFEVGQNVDLMIASMGFTSARDGWLWTAGGRLFQTTDGGLDWSQMM